MFRPALLNQFSIDASAFSSSTSGSPRALASAFRVRSSSVGPRPPVRIHTSLFPTTACNASTIFSIPSLTQRRSTVLIPQESIARDNQGPLVSIRSPRINSSPIVSIETFADTRIIYQLHSGIDF